MNWPTEIPSGASSVPVWLVDLLPTFAELGGVLAVPETDGSSLVPIWTGDAGSFPSDRPLYWENAREQAVRMGPWKAYRPSPAEPLELFLIEEDVGCERDLSGVYPQVVATIETVMSESTSATPGTGIRERRSRTFSGRRRWRKSLASCRWPGRATLLHSVRTRPVLGGRSCREP